jgi:hypothetical protein
VPGLRFYLDENVDVRIADALRRRGVHASTAGEAGMLGASDEDQLIHAARSRAVLVTGDHDFVTLAREWLERNRHHSSVIFIAYGRARVGYVLRLLLLCDELLDPADVRDRIEFM